MDAKDEEAKMNVEWGASDNEVVQRMGNGVLVEWGGKNYLR